MRALIVDDEALARSSLAAVLATFQADIEVVGEARNGIEALEQIEELNPDVVFLDIEMPGLNGFEVLAQLREPPPIVFVTAYDEYAVKAFEANAVDYILKPLQPARVQQAVAKLRGRTREEYQAPLRKILKDFRAPTKIAGRKGKRIVLLAPKEVRWIGIDDKLVFLHSAAEKLLTDRTVAELEEMLGVAGFFRINRGELVNLEFARELIPWFSGTWRLKMDSGEELDVSRERARELKDLMGL